MAATDYWIHGKTSLVTGLDLGTVSNQLQADDMFCLTIKNTADNSNPIVVKSENCTLKRQVICKLEPHIALENAAPALPPKFPCISTDQAVTRKNKREVGTVTIHRPGMQKSWPFTEYYETIFFYSSFNLSFFNLLDASKSEVSKELIKDIKFENDVKTKDNTKGLHEIVYVIGT